MNSAATNLMRSPRSGNGDPPTVPISLMHADSTIFDGLSKEESYEQLLESLRGLLVDNWVANLANTASLLWYHFHSQPRPQASVNWAGFYVMDGSKLVLGPFQGKVACQEIAVGSGVCGTAAELKKTQRVDNVHEFPGHIACDGDTNSEIVVPILGKNDRCLGVIDIDCTDLHGFDETDMMYLNNLARILATSLENARL